MTDPSLSAAIDQVDTVLGDKKGALLDLARHLGLFAEKPSPSLPDRVTDPDPRTLAMAVLEMLREAKMRADAPLELELQPAE